MLWYCSPKPSLKLSACAPGNLAVIIVGTGLDLVEELLAGDMGWQFAVYVPSLRGGSSPKPMNPRQPAPFASGEFCCEKIRPDLTRLARLFYLWLPFPGCLVSQTPCVEVRRIYFQLRISQSCGCSSKKATGDTIAAQIVVRHRVQRLAVQICHEMDQGSGGHPAFFCGTASAERNVLSSSETSPRSRNVPAGRSTSRPRGELSPAEYRCRNATARFPGRWVRMSSGQVDASAIGSVPPSLQYLLRVGSMGPSRRICLTIARACGVRFRSAIRATTW